MFFEVPELASSPFPALQTLHVEGRKVNFKGIDCERNFKRPSMQRGLCPIYKGTLKTFECSLSTEIGCANLSKPTCFVFSCVQSALCVCSLNSTQRTHISVLAEHTKVSSVPYWNSAFSPFIKQMFFL